MAGEQKKHTSRADKKEVGRLNLLAAAASHNYQRCYQALKALETYWAGTRYILTVLDQKAKGSLDPLLYTAEDLGDTAELRGPIALPASSAWKHLREQSGGHTAADHRGNQRRLRSAGSPSHEASHLARKIDPSQGKHACIFLTKFSSKLGLTFNSHWMVFDRRYEFL